MQNDLSLPRNLVHPPIENLPISKVKVRLSIEKSCYFSLVFIAGNQARIVEVNEELTDNINALKGFLNDLISDKSEAYIEVDGLYMVTCIDVCKLDHQHILLRVFELDYKAVEPFEGDRGPRVFIEAKVELKRLVWELYTSFCKLPPMATGAGFSYYPKHGNKDWCKMPEVEAWLNLRALCDWMLYPDDDI